MPSTINTRRQNGERDVANIFTGQLAKTKYEFYYLEGPDSDVSITMRGHPLSRGCSLLQHLQPRLALFLHATTSSNIVFACQHPFKTD